MLIRFNRISKFRNSFPFMGFQINDSVRISDWLKIKINLKTLLRLFLALIESFESLGSQDISSVSESPQASFFSICFFIAFNSAIFVDNAIFLLENVSSNQVFYREISLIFERFLQCRLLSH